MKETDKDQIFEVIGMLVAFVIKLAGTIGGVWFLITRL